MSSFFLNLVGNAGLPIRGTEIQHSLGFGFVNFSSECTMDAVIESMHGKDLDGQPITVNRTLSIE